MKGKSLIKCAILGGLVVFIWGMISWGLLPWHRMSYHQFRNEMQVAQVIQQNAPESGFYVVPNVCNPPDGMSKEQWEAQKMQNKDRMHAGPYIFASVRLQGMNFDAVGPYIVSFITQIIGAFLITWLLMKTKIQKYSDQVCFVTVVGLTVGFLSAVPAWNWMGFPCGATIISIIDMAIAWFLAGLVIAKFAKE